MKLVVSRYARFIKKLYSDLPNIVYLSCLCTTMHTTKVSLMYETENGVMIFFFGTLKNYTTQYGYIR